MADTNFKFKPDKIKYLNNITTLDSSHQQNICTRERKTIRKIKK